MPRGPRGDKHWGPSPLSINDPEHWHQRAEEARTIANQIDDLQAKAAMLRIAEDYERLAKRAGQRAIGRPPNSD
jgi:hypothetical protein